MRFAGFNVANLIGGGALALIGAYAIIAAASYPIGQLNRMGPGFVPLALGIVLVALSLGIMVQGREAEMPLPRLRMRALISISAAIIGFAVTVMWFGIVPATFVVVMLSSFADERFHPGVAVVASAVLAAFAYLVFIVGLGVPMDAFRWFR